MLLITDIISLFPNSAALISNKLPVMGNGDSERMAQAIQPAIELYESIFIEDLIAIITLHKIPIGLEEPVPVALFTSLQTFLHHHWQVIKQDYRLHYQYDPFFSFNAACLALAAFCAKGLNQSCASILYPDLLEATCRITGNSIVDLDTAPHLPPLLPTAVLSECGKYFIEIDVCFEEAIKNGDAVLRHTQKLTTLENKHVMAPLSAKEIEIVTSHNRYAAKLYEAIKEMHRCQFASPTVGAWIAALIAGLRDGGAYSTSLKFRIGRANNAGLQANESILAFFNFIDSLPDAIREELQKMRSDRHSFDALMRSLSDRDHQQKLSLKQQEIDARPAAKAYQMAELSLSRFMKNHATLITQINQSNAPEHEKEKKHVELDREKATLEENLAAAIKNCDKTDKQLWHELSNLSSHIGQCVEITANNWQAFLTCHSDRLYSMTLDRTASVSEQIRLLGQRINQYQQDLYAYLDMLYEYLMLRAARTEQMPEKFENFSAERLVRPCNDILADYLYQWLISATDTKDRHNKLARLLSLVKARPQFLFEINLFARLPESYLKILVTDFNSTFFEPILTSLCRVVEFSLNNDSRCLAILRAIEIASARHSLFLPNLSGFARESGLRTVAANLARLLLASGDLNLLREEQGYRLLKYAVTTNNVELTALLVERGASAYLQDESNADPHLMKLVLALRNPSIDLIKALLPTLTSYDEVLVSLACNHNASSIGSLVFNRLVDAGQDGLPLAELYFKHACLKTNASVLRFALNKGARRCINLLEDGTSPLAKFATDMYCDDRALAVEALIHAGADVEFIHPDTKLNVLSQVLQFIWADSITCNYSVYRPQEHRQRIQNSMTRHTAVLENLLRGRLPADSIENDVKGNMLQWVLQTISTPIFELAFKYSYQNVKDIAFQNIMQILDLLTVDQQKLLMLEYYNKGVRSALMKFLPERYANILAGRGIAGFLVELITDKEIPSRYALFFFLLNYPDSNELHSSLLSLSISNDVYLAQRLIELPGININYSLVGDTLVMRAVRALDGLPILKQLVKRGARIDCQCKDGNLFHATEHASIETIQYLLSPEFEHDLTEESLSTATTRRLAVRELLTQRNHHNKYALAVLITRMLRDEKNHVALMTLLERLFDRVELFNLAIFYGAESAIRYLFDPQIHLTVTSFNLLTMNYHEDTMLFFCEKMQSEPDRFRDVWNRLLMLSVMECSSPLFNAVMKMERYVDLNKLDEIEDMTLLMMAARHQPGMVVDILKYNPDIQVRTRLAGQTALDMVCHELLLNISRIILDDDDIEYKLQDLLCIYLNLRLRENANHRLNIDINDITDVDAISEDFLEQMIPAILHDYFYRLGLSGLQQTIQIIEKEPAGIDESFLIGVALAVKFMSGDQVKWFAATYFNQLVGKIYTGYRTEDGTANWNQALFNEVGLPAREASLRLLVTAKPEVSVDFIDADSGLSVLQFAITQPDNLRFLLSHFKPDVNRCVASQTMTLLEGAIRHGAVDSVRVLIRHGANVRLKNSAGETPMMIAARLGDMEKVKTLLMREIQEDSNKPDVPYDSTEAVSMLLEEDSHGKTAITHLIDAVQQQFPESIGPMLQSLTEIVNIEEIFFFALRSGLIEVVHKTFNPVRHLTKAIFETVLKESSDEIVIFFCIEFGRPPSSLVPELSPDDWYELMDLSLTCGRREAFHLASRKISYQALNHTVNDEGKNLLMRTASYSGEFTSAILRTLPDISIVNQHNGKTALDYAYENLFASVANLAENNINLEITCDTLRLPQLSEKWTTFLDLVKYKESQQSYPVETHISDNIRFLRYMVKHTSTVLMSECITRYVLMNAETNHRMLVILAQCLPYMTAEQGFWFSQTYFQRLNTAIFPSETNFEKLLFSQNGNCDHWKLLFLLYAKPDMSRILFSSEAGMSKLLSECFFPEDLSAILDICKLDINAIRLNGSTLLIEAVEKWRLPVVSALLKHGADATLPNSDGDTALLIGMRIGVVGICDEILSQSKNKFELLTQENPLCESALSSALNLASGNNLARLKCITFDEQLLTYINPRTQMSLLMEAAHNANLTSLLWLIQAGADIHLQNSLKHTVKDYANDKKVGDAIDFILKHHLQNRLDLQEWATENTEKSRAVLAFLTHPEFKGICGDINKALMNSVQRGFVDNVQILLEGGAEPMASGIMSYARDFATCNRNHLTAVLAKHIVEQYIKVRTAEPENRTGFGRNGWFGTPRQPGRSEELNSANQFLQVIDRYLQASQYSQTTLSAFLMQYRSELLLEELRDGRLRQICITILGESDYCLLYGGRTQGLVTKIF
jgi:ankyrin repeat protein